MNTLLAAFRYTTNNWTQVHASKSCGCCICLKIFAPDDVVGWTGLDIDKLDDAEAVATQTAMCPHCGGEAVIGDSTGFPVNMHSLVRMNEAWFQRTAIRRTAASEKSVPDK